MAKQIKYSEPVGYFPKAIRDKLLKDAKKASKPEKKATPKKK